MKPPFPTPSRAARRRTRLRRVATPIAPMLLALPTWAAAQSLPFFPGITPNDALEQREEQREDEARRRAMARPDVLSPPVNGAAEQDEGRLTLPEESPCFPIQAVDWEGAEDFGWLVDETDALLGQCVGAQGIQAIRDYLSARLVHRGYITTRVLIPAQNLSAGSLRLQVVAGRIEAIRATAPVGWWRMAFPTGPGGLLNQRDLDQALENIRRLSGQADAAIELAPGAHPGEAQVQVTPGTGRRWHGLLTADNAGLQNTGRYQLGGTLTVDSPLFLYDSLTLSGNSNADFSHSAAGTRSSAINYSIPFGYASVFFNANQSRYKQTVAGFGENIVYSGRNTQIEAGVGVVPWRGASGKANVYGKVFRKSASSSINDQDLAVQHRDFVGVELGAAYRQYLGAAVVDISAAWRESLPGSSQAPGFVLGDPNWDGKSEILLNSISVMVPFHIADQRLRYQGTLRMQHALTRILPSDYFVIGNRYAVRGFDEQLTLAAEDGIALRNDLAWPLGQSGQEVFFGFDAGHVSGPSAGLLVGQTLMGAVLGVRGNWALGGGTALNYELALGTPVKKPEYFRSQATNVMMQVGVVF